MYNHAEWYVSQVVALAQTYYNQGAGQGTGSSQPTFASVCANVATSGYVDPLADIQNLRPERIDMGVDYSGHGTIIAIGAGQITTVHNAGWPNGTFIEERLSSGPYAGKTGSTPRTSPRPSIPAKPSPPASRSARCSRALTASKRDGQSGPEARPSPPASARVQALATPVHGQAVPEPPPVGCCNRSARPLG